MPDVLVAGAGPTGLMAAYELERAGLDVLVLERDARPTTQSKALALQPRSVEVLSDRGLLAAIEPHVQARIPAGHFSGIPIDYAGLPTPFPYQLGVEQACVAATIEARLRTPVLRGADITAVAQDHEGVTVTAGGRDHRAGWLVAADGGHSTVRRLLGVAFPGTSARFSLVVADFTLVDRPAGLADDWQLPSIASGFLLPLSGGRFRAVVGGEEQQRLDRDAVVTAEELQRALTDAHGPGIEVGEVLWASRFGDAARQLEQYRHGRVLFAGDAAHIHLPVGGQGLNLGLQDAVNLGWKLAAQVHGHAPDGLLDSYHEERHPIAARVLVSTRAQGALGLPHPDAAAVRRSSPVSSRSPRPGTPSPWSCRASGSAIPAPPAAPPTLRPHPTVAPYSSAHLRPRAGPTASRPATARGPSSSARTATWRGRAARAWTRRYAAGSACRTPSARPAPRALGAPARGSCPSAGPARTGGGVRRRSSRR